MQFQTAILTLLAFTAAPLLATPLSREFTSLQPRAIRSESCQEMKLSIAAIQDQLSGDGECDEQCKAEANEALDALKEMQEQFPCDP